LFHIIPGENWLDSFILEFHNKKNYQSFDIYICICNSGIFLCSKKAQDVSSGQHQMPHLIKQGKTTQLIVDDKPFLILAGELGLMLPVQV
jgi:hypothetical protein